MCPVILIRCLIISVFMSGCLPSCKELCALFWNLVHVLEGQHFLVLFKTLLAWFSVGFSRGSAALGLPWAFPKPALLCHAGPRRPGAASSLQAPAVPQSLVLGQSSLLSKCLPWCRLIFRQTQERVDCGPPSLHGSLRSSSLTQIPSEHFLCNVTAP